MRCRRGWLERGVKLDAWQFRGLWHSARTAKERLLADPELQGEPVVILGRGSSLIGGTIRSELTRAEVEQTLLDGFFPVGESSDYPEAKPKVGVREMGLPYEADPAVTRHLARFLGRQAQGDPSQSGIPVGYPAAILFNGGVMKSGLLRERVLSVSIAGTARRKSVSSPRWILILLWPVGPLTTDWRAMAEAFAFVAAPPGRIISALKAPCPPSPASRHQ